MPNFSLSPVRAALLILVIRNDLFIALASLVPVGWLPTLGVVPRQVQGRRVRALAAVTPPVLPLCLKARQSGRSARRHFFRILNF